MWVLIILMVTGRNDGDVSVTTQEFTSYGKCYDAAKVVQNFNLPPVKKNKIKVKCVKK